MGTTRTRSWAGALLVPLLILAACGGGDDDDGDGGSAAPTADEATDRLDSPGEPEAGGTLIELVPAYLDNLDLQTQSSTNTQNPAGVVYSRLLAFEVGPGVTSLQELEGDLAESWEVSDDGLTYTFHLRDGVTWHDIPPVNGRPFVAQDVVASMNRVKSVGVAAYMLERVVSIEAPDPATVVFRLSSPFAPLLNYLATSYMNIFPEEATNGGFDPKTLAIGTGPFVMTSRVPNVEHVYEANPNYYGEGPHIDGWKRVVVPDQGARINAFRAGDADIISGLSPQEIDQVLGTTSGAVEIDQLATSNLAVYVNQAKPPMDSLEFRKAISMAIDREGLGEAIYAGGALTGPVLTKLGKWALPEDELADLYPYDPEGAEELLAEAGLSDVTIGLLATTGYGEQVVRGAQWIAEDLAEVGINATIELADYATYFGSRWPEQQYDIIVGLQTPFSEPDEWLRAQHHSTASRNWFGIADPALDAMLEHQLEVIDEDERVDEVHDIQRYIVENVMNPIPVWNYNTSTLLSARVRDYFPDDLYGYWEFRLVWLDQG
jgi:peptide/nickel transport system substrate-binding protein